MTVTIRASAFDARVLAAVDRAVLEVHAATDALRRPGEPGAHLDLALARARQARAMIEMLTPSAAPMARRLRA